MDLAKVAPEKIPEDSFESRRPALFRGFDNNKITRKRHYPHNSTWNSVDDRDPGTFEVPQTNKHLKRLALEELKNDDIILAILSALCAGFALAENEETFYRIPENESYTLYLRLGIVIFSLASVIWVIRRYQMILLLEVLKYTVGTSDTLITTGLYKPMMLEIFISCIFSPPGYDYYFSFDTLGYTITYSIDDIFTFFALLRLYNLLRLFGHHSIYTQSTAETVCERHGQSADTVFALKSYIQDSPFVGIIIVFLSISLFSAACMRIAERPERYSDGTVAQSSLENLSDNLWVIFYTTTTVGYGNIYPVTHMGRLTCIIACIFGNMYLGMLVVAIHQKMDHDDNENLAYSWIYRYHSKSSLEIYAKNAIRCAGKLYLLSKKWPKGCISKIKPNPQVKIENKTFDFDLKYLSFEQYRKKSDIYREMKKNLMKMEKVVTYARNAGQKDAETIKLIDDTVRVDTSLILRKIQNMINKETLLTNSAIISSQQSMEQKLAEVNDNANNLRKIFRRGLRKKTGHDSQKHIKSE